MAVREVLGLLVVAVFSLWAAQASQPNIVYLLTDDQDLKLGSLDVLPVVKSLLAEQGMVFSNAFTTTPVCCPSRSSILTGKYVHNHKTFENSIETGCDAPSWRQLNEDKTIGAYMGKAGYQTGFFGKYLNNYGYASTGVDISHIPPGWTRWYTLQGNSKYYDYTVSNQGKADFHGHNYTLDYFTDLIATEAVKFIQTVPSDKPFFTYISTPAPHRPATPAPQYASKFAGQKAPRTPSYHYNGTDKHWIISDGTPYMNEAVIELVDELYQMRLETLLSVQDLLQKVVDTLQEKNILNNTYIIYHSDHGYHLGQFNQQGEKRQPYDEDIRVPLIVRGPGIKPNTMTSGLALNIDIAPTIMDLADLPLPPDMDGVSLKSLLLGGEPEETGFQFLVEYFGAGYALHKGCFNSSATSPLPFLHDCINNTFIGLRMSDSSNGDELYTMFFSNDTVPLDKNDIYFTEYYNITQDSWQLHNSISSLSPQQVSLYNSTLWNYHNCYGVACHTMRKKWTKFSD